MNSNVTKSLSFRGHPEKSDCRHQPGRSSRTSGASLARPPIVAPSRQAKGTVATPGGARGRQQPVHGHPEVLVATSQACVSRPPAPPLHSRRPRATFPSPLHRPGEQERPSRDPWQRVVVTSYPGSGPYHPGCCHDLHRLAGSPVSLSCSRSRRPLVTLPLPLRLPIDFARPD